MEMGKYLFITDDPGNELNIQDIEGYLRYLLSRVDGIGVKSVNKH